MKTCEMSKQINQEKLEEWLINNLVSEAERYNFDLEQQKKTAPKKTIDTAKILAKIEKLKDLYISDLLPKEIYERDYNELSHLLKEAAAQEAAVPAAKALDLNKLENFAESYKKLTLESRKAFWSHIINQITVTPDGDYILTFNQL